MRARHRIGIRIVARLLPGLLGVCLAAPAIADDAESAPTPGAALRKGTFSLDWRYRYELVDQDGIEKNAWASTLRTSIRYGSKSYYGFLGGFEVEDVTVVGKEDTYNNLGAGGLHNGATDRPVVADPEILEFNQVWLAFEGLRGTRLQGGRQEYVRDNQRFVGNVGWRQNHQSFEAAAVEIDAVENWGFRYAFLGRQHTVTGASLEMSSHLVHVGYDSPVGKAAAYGYLFDYGTASLFDLSTATWGLRLDGKTPVSRFEVLYLAEYARQSDLADNPGDFQLDYVHARVGGQLDSWSLEAAFEMLGGDGTNAVQTPAGTNHKFNGFADKFLVTPADGLRDLYFRLSWKREAWSALAAYHFFDADEGDRRYGDELDLQAVYKTHWKQQFALKFARYDADRFATDTTKLMLWTAWGF